MPVNINYKEHLANWLKSYHWDYFITVTPRQPRYDGMAYMRDIWQYLAEDYTVRFEEYGVERAFLACEPFETHHDLHAHGLLFGSDIQLPWVIGDDLNHRFGRSRCELARSHSQVSAYCAKYVTKDHRCDNWNMFGQW